MPFLSGVLERNLCQLMKMFLHAAVVDEVTTPYKLIKLNLQKKDSFFLYDTVKLPMQRKYFKHHLKQLQHKFKEFCSVILKNTVLRLQERSPLTSMFSFS